MCAPRPALNFYGAVAATLEPLTSVECALASRKSLGKTDLLTGFDNKVLSTDALDIVIVQYVLRRETTSSNSEDRTPEFWKSLLNVL